MTDKHKLQACLLSVNNMIDEMVTIEDTANIRHSLGNVRVSIGVMIDDMDEKAERELLQDFIGQYIEGEQGCEMDNEAAQALARAIEKWVN